LRSLPDGTLAVCLLAVDEDALVDLVTELAVIASSKSHLRESQIAPFGGRLDRIFAGLTGSPQSLDDLPNVGPASQRGPAVARPQLNRRHSALGLAGQADVSGQEPCQGEPLGLAERRLHSAIAVDVDVVAMGHLPGSG